MNTTEDTTLGKYDFLNSTGVEITTIVCHIITISSSIVGLISNSLILCCIKRQKSLQTYQNVSLVNMCIVSIIGCIVLIPVRCIIFGMYVHDSNSLNILCKISTFFRSFCEIFQLSMLVTVSYERYSAVLSPFEKYGRKKRVLLTIIISWCLALTCGSISSGLFLDSAIYLPCKSEGKTIMKHWANFDSFIGFPFGCVAFTFVLIFYICIFKALIKQSKTIQSHTTIGKRKVHPMENNIATTSTNNIRAVSQASFKSKDILQTGEDNKTLSVPVNEGNDGSSSEQITKLTQISQKTTIEEYNGKANIPVNTLPNIDQTSACGNTTEYLPDGGVRVIITETPNSLKKSLSVAEVRTGEACDNKNHMSHLKVEKVGRIHSTKTYEIYDADGTIRIENTSSDNVVGAVCMLNPKNKEHGKRKIEAKIAKNIAIGIGLFGLVWIPLPLFVVINYSLPYLQEQHYHLLIILSSISITIYSINSIVTIFTNRKIKSECIHVLQYLKILRKK